MNFQNILSIELSIENDGLNKKRIDDDKLM